MSDTGGNLDRTYPYCSGWRVTGCSVLMFGILGGAAVALLPLGYEQLQNGRMPIGVAMMVGGVFGTPMILMALASLAAGLREAFRPPVLRVSTGAIHLPASLCDPAATEQAAEPDAPPAPRQPEVIPFSAVRWARREGPRNPGSHRIVIVHDLAPATLVIEQYLMRWGDFDELETVLRAAIPAAFDAPAPPK